MAEKEKKPDAPAPAPAPAPAEKKASSGGMLKSTPVLLGVVMLIEAAVLFAGFKFFGGPKSAQGADLNVTEASGGHGGGDSHGGGAEGAKVDPKKCVELPVLNFKAPNKLTGRTFLYDVSIFAVTRAEKKDQVKQAITDREATIQDRIRTIIAQSDPEKLGGGSEPGLETLRRQVKHQLDEIIGEGLVEEILIPRCIPYRAEF